MKRFMNISKKHSSVYIAILLVLSSCDSNGSNINEYTADMLNCNTETNNCYDKKSNKPITGLVKEYYDNSGKHIKSEVTYKDGLLNGSKKLYYIDGKTKLETNFVNGIENGTAKVYYSNGKLKEESTFTDGKPNGTVKQYYSNGNLKEETTTKNGFVEGIVKKYYENGQQSFEANYKDGWKLYEINYNENGNKVSELVYEYKEHGSSTLGYEIIYNLDGTIKSKEEMIQMRNAYDSQNEESDIAKQNNRLSGSCPNYCLNIKDEYERIASASYCPMIKNEGKPLAQMMNKEYQKVEQKYWDEMKKHCPPSLCDYSDFQLDPFRFCHF